VPRYSSVFKDESKLDINYVPPHLLHRKLQLNLLNQFFRFVVDSPGKMTQRALIIGKIGTGKTVLSQHFGLNIAKEAKQRNINLNYVHINCRECKGSLFMILQRTIMKFYPTFPRRGYSAEELLQALMQVLDEKDAYLILTLDELESLVRNEGSDPLYNLSRIQEDRTVPPQTLGLIAELGNSEGGNARYSIELLWRAGKYADALEMQEVLPECVRQAVVSVYPVVRRDMIPAFSVHEKLFLLGVARHFKQSDSAYMSMGEAEEAYALVCEEYGEKIRGHTQIWKYVKALSTTGIIETLVSGVGKRGKTTMISLSRVPASDLEQEIVKLLSQEGGGEGQWR
jgi:cell division control protein 6